jgi:hypothetical protein
MESRGPILFLYTRDMATPIYGTLLFGPDQMMLEDGSKLNT